LVEYVDWRWIFTINLPIGVLGLLLSWFYLPLFSRRDPGPLDLGRALTSALGLFCLLLALSKGNEWGKAWKRPVVLGLEDGERVLVIRGLEEGEGIAVTNVGALREGMAVEEER